MMFNKTRLLVVWVLLTILTLAVQGVERQFEPPQVQQAVILGDACQNTCPPDGICIHLRTYNYDCCTWDWGCWANPEEPDYQIGPCKRDVFICIYPDLGIPCCNAAYNCSELDGAPCCYPFPMPCP